MSRWTVARQSPAPAPLSMGVLQSSIFQWLPCPPPGDLPNPGIKPRSPTLQVDSLPSEPPGRPKNTEVGILPSPGELPDPGIELGSPALHADSFYPGSPVSH